MLAKEFDYELPERLVAVRPPKVRGSSRLLVLDRHSGELEDSWYADLAGWLRPGDLLVLNDTRVMRARLMARLADGRERELVVLEKHEGEPERVMYRGKLHAGDKLLVGDVEMRVREILGGGVAEVESAVGLMKLTERAGEVPLPPYLRREAEAADVQRYQTVWAKEMGSAAAPTASLNMTEELLEKLRDKGARVEFLTLHVGLGTFLPMRSEKVEDHQMHAEWFDLPERTVAEIEQARAEDGRVVALGTTVARALEYWGQIGKTRGENDIFIYPGFEFRVVDALITNFHAPRSTVLMLAAAFAGWDNLRAAYAHAKREEYAFLSYGDSMLIC